MAILLDLRYDFMLGNIENELLVNANYEDRDIRFKQYSIYDADKVIKNKAGEVIYQGALPYILIYASQIGLRMNLLIMIRLKPVITIKKYKHGA